MESSNRIKLEEALRIGFFVTNNKAEYEALIYGLELARHIGVYKLQVQSDLAVVTRQVSGNFEVKEP